MFDYTDLDIDPADCEYSCFEEQYQEYTKQFDSEDDLPMSFEEFVIECIEEEKISWAESVYEEDRYA